MPRNTTSDLNNEANLVAAIHELLHGTKVDEYTKTIRQNISAVVRFANQHEKQLLKHNKAGAENSMTDLLALYEFNSLLLNMTDSKSIDTVNIIQFLEASDFRLNDFYSSVKEGANYDLHKAARTLFEEFVKEVIVHKANSEAGDAMLKTFAGEFKILRVLLSIEDDNWLNILSTESSEKNNQAGFLRSVVAFFSPRKDEKKASPGSSSQQSKTEGCPFSIQ